MRHVSRKHADAYLRDELRSVLDYIAQQHIAAAGRVQHGSRLQRSHASLLLKAAKTCSHPLFAVSLIEYLWPPPLTESTPRGGDARWPREMESCYAIVTDCTPSPWPIASPGLLLRYLSFLQAHSYPLLPSMLTPALQLCKEHSDWQRINELFTYCVKRSVPIPRSAYPLFLVAQNHTRNYQQALLLLAHALANVPSSVPLDQWYPIYHAAIDVMGVCGETEKAMQLVQYMRDQGMQFTPITYTAAINALCKAAPAAYTHLQSLHAELQQRGITHTQQLYRALVRAYMHFDQQDEAITLITHFMKVHHDPATAFFMLSVSVEVENVEAAVLMLDKIGARRTESLDDKWCIRLPLYNRVLELVVRQARWDSLRAVWGMRTALHVSANITSYYFVAQALDAASRTWSTLEARVMELLHWRDGNVLDVRNLPGQWTVRAVVWWAVKAAELRWRRDGSWQLGIDVLVSVDKKADVLAVLDERGLSSEVGEVMIRVSATVIERWRRNKRIARPIQRTALKDGASDKVDELQLLDNEEPVMPSQLRKATAL